MIVAIIGEKGSSKSTTESILVDVGNYEKVVSYTTRKPRSLEVNGVDYWFVDKGEFKYMSNEDMFVEEVKYNNNMYGITKKALQSKINKVIVVEPSGLKQIMNTISSDNICVIKLQCDYAERVSRIVKRDEINCMNELMDLAYNLFLDQRVMDKVDWNKVADGIVDTTNKTIVDTLENCLEIIDNKVDN